MKKLNQILSVIFYLIWIPLGLLIFGGIVFLIVAKPFAGLMSMMEQFGGGAEGGFIMTTPGGDQGSFPSKEMMEQFMQQGGSPGGAQFGEPPAGKDSGQPDQ